MDNDVVRVQNRAFARLSATGLFVLLLICVIGALAQLPSKNWGLLVLSGISLGLLLRSRKIGLTVYPDHVTKHGWFENQDIARDRIRKIQLVHYSGYLHRGGQSPSRHMLCLELDDEVIELPEFCAGSGKALDLYAQVSDLLDVPYTPPDIPLPTRNPLPPRHAKHRRSNR